MTEKIETTWNQEYIEKELSTKEFIENLTTEQLKIVLKQVHSGNITEDELEIVKWKISDILDPLLDPKSLINKFNVYVLAEELEKYNPRTWKKYTGDIIKFRKK